jgi:hypothetical protein
MVPPSIWPRVDAGFTGEGVRGRGQPPVRALRQQGCGRLIAHPMGGGGVGKADALRAGVDIEEVPGGDRAVSVQAGPDVDHGHRAQVPALELLRPAPVHLHRPSCSTGEAGGLDGLVAMFAAEAAPGGRHDHPHVRLIGAERARRAGRVPRRGRCCRSRRSAVRRPIRPRLLSFRAGRGRGRRWDGRAANRPCRRAGRGLLPGGAGIGSPQR